MDVYASVRAERRRLEQAVDKCKEQEASAMAAALAWLDIAGQRASKLKDGRTCYTREDTKLRIDNESSGLEKLCQLMYSRMTKAKEAGHPLSTELLFNKSPNQEYLSALIEARVDMQFADRAEQRLSEEEKEALDQERRDFFVQVAKACGLYVHTERSARVRNS